MRRAYIIAGLLYGDEGKGATVDFLTRQREAGLVVRYNGGCQAQHNVVTSEGQHHTFSQFGSGTLAGATSHLSRYVMVNPINMQREADHLVELGIRNPFDRISISPWSLITTPFHRALNRLEQLATGNKNTCGMGIGKTQENFVELGYTGSLLVRDLEDGDTARKKLKAVKDWCFSKIHHSWYWRKEHIDIFSDNLLLDITLEQYARWIEKILLVDDRCALAEHDSIIFEGAQGVLLDEVYGEVGFNTWSNTTFDNAINLLKIGNFDGRIQKVGVIRSYLTRHGDGLFSESDKLTHLKELHNTDTNPPGRFKYGHLDVGLLDKAIRICGPDWIALNHLDQLDSLGNLESWLRTAHPSIKIKIKGHGPTAKDKLEIKNERSYAKQSN